MIQHRLRIKTTEKQARKLKMGRSVKGSLILVRRKKLIDLPKKQHYWKAEVEVAYIDLLNSI